ncbi:MAG: hypothetical protein O6945_03565 [Gammaproteobacteria bacterium]|nr:hypothetical protein [Gammaproteobacteria bacterium]
MQTAFLKPCLYLFSAFLCLTTLTALAKTPGPLFANNDLIRFTLEAPFKKINRDRNKEKLYPDSTLTFEDENGEQVTLPVQLQVRGNSRLAKETCRYAPLRIHFDKTSIKDTLFDKQKKLKLVILCKKNSTYQDYLMQEYLIYRMFNILTDSSFKVKIAEVTFLETGGSKKPMTSYAFFIEDKKRLGKRLGLDTIRGNRISYTALDPAPLSLVTLFQYMVGNTDYSVLKGEAEEDCCHNAKMLGIEGRGHTPVPYDFDFSGIIGASYAVPPEGVGIQNVRTRLYRGFCKPDMVSLDSSRAIIQSHKEALYALLEADPLLSNRARKKSLKYLDSYYKISEDDKKFEKSVVKKCRGKK